MHFNVFSYVLVKLICVRLSMKKNLVSKFRKTFSWFGTPEAAVALKLVATSMMLVNAVVAYRNSRKNS